MRAEIITVGSELTTGRTLDTHSRFLSRICYELGIEVAFHTTVGDEIQRLIQAISIASSRAELVFLCGGLGPTQDDLTREALAEYLGVSLVQDPQLVKRLKEYFAKRDVPMPENNLKQAQVFPNSIIFPNDHGTAVGLAVSREKVTYVLLPGPPRELYPMVEKHVLPFLRQRFSGSLVWKTHHFSFFGIGESVLEMKLKDVMTNTKQLEMATYVDDSGVTLRVIARAPSEAEAKAWIEEKRAEILKRVGHYCYSEEGKTLEETAVSLLKERGKTVSVAESCTGGLLASLITSVPGSSQVFPGGFVSYSAQSKEGIVHVSEQTIARFGTVSAQTAQELAEQTLTSFSTDFALSITGVAGPDPAEGKEVGTVYIGLAESGKPARIYQFHFLGNRQRIRLMAAKQALFLLFRRLQRGL
jgi:nicotinamide-nucleotide amidase